MAIEMVSGPGLLNSNYFLTFELTKSASDKLNMVPHSATGIGDRKDAFMGAGTGDILQIDSSKNKYGKTQKQNEISTQITAKTKSLITLNDSTTVNGKKRFKRVSVSFPHNCPVIFQTKILNDYIGDVSVIRLFKGRLTWKRNPGGRYGIVEVPESIITTMMNEKIAAQVAAQAQSTESTTTRIETEPRSV